MLIESDGKNPLSPFITFRFSHGHTPGLMLAEIHLDEGPLVFASDLIPGFAWMHIPISMGYDRFPELLIDEKRIFLEDLFPKNGTLFFTHDAKYAFGKIKQDTKGKFFAEVFDYLKGK